MRKLVFVSAAICFWLLTTCAFALSPQDYYNFANNADNPSNLPPVYPPNAGYTFTINNMIGDNDGYGYGPGIVPDGADLPFTSKPDGSPYGWLFDNRDADELVATDGSQATDMSSAFDVTFHHSFDISQFDYLSQAIFSIDVSGIQPNYFGPDGYTRLYLDGVEVTEFAAIENQGAWGSGIFSFNVDLDLLTDGKLDVFVDVFEHYDGELRSADEIAIDFTNLSVTGVRNAIPEPTTLALMGLGISGLVLRRRWKR